MEGVDAGGPTVDVIVRRDEESIVFWEDDVPRGSEDQIHDGAIGERGGFVLFPFVPVETELWGPGSISDAIGAIARETKTCELVFEIEYEGGCRFPRDGLKSPEAVVVANPRVPNEDFFPSVLLGREISGGALEVGLEEHLKVGRGGFW